MDDEIITDRTWSRLHYYMKKILPPSFVHQFGFHIEETKVNHVFSAENARTFKKTYTWLDERGFYWRRVGLSVFDFRTKYGILPSGNITLHRTYNGIHIVLKCEIKFSHLNDRATIDESIYANRESRQTSKVCGRASLQVMEYEIYHMDRDDRREYTEERRANISSRRKFNSLHTREGMEFELSGEVRAEKKDIKTLGTIIDKRRIA